MVGKIRRRIIQSLENADSAVDNIEESALRVLTAVTDILEEGITFQLEIAGTKIPVKIIIEPDDES